MKRRNILTFSIIFTIALCLISFINIPSVPAYDFNVVDYYDNTSYYTQTNNQTVTIQSSFATSQFYADSPVIACSVYRGNFSFLSLTTDNNHYSTTIYKYNFQKWNRIFSLFHNKRYQISRWIKFVRFWIAIPLWSQFKIFNE